MWDSFEILRHRHSVHHYPTDLPVSREQLHAILEVACPTQSAGDLQSYRIFGGTIPAQHQALLTASGDKAF